ncbi:unnamed protein product, partial [Polarella glacialis]
SPLTTTAGAKMVNDTTPVLATSVSEAGWHDLMSTCSICLDMLRDPVVLGCDGEHMVCREHLDELFECPMCRGPVGIPQKPQKSVLRALVAMRAD